MQSFINTLIQLILKAVWGSLSQVGLLQAPDRLRPEFTKQREASLDGVGAGRELKEPASGSEKRPRRRRRPRRRSTDLIQDDSVTKETQTYVESTKADPRRPKVIVAKHKKAKEVAVGATKLASLMPHRMIFYTDGSTHMKEAIHGAGVTYKCFPAEPKDMLWNDESYGIFGTHTIDIAEMLAITCALKIAVREAPRYSQRNPKGVCKFGVFIFTDSEVSLTTIRNYLSSDNRLSVREAFLCEQSSAEIPGLLKSLYEAGAKVEFHWVPGHSGVIGNTRADRLSKDAAEAARPITGRHHVPPHGRDFEIISVKDLVRERFEMEKDQRRDQIEDAVTSFLGALLNQGKSPTDILAFTGEITTVLERVLERAALNQSSSQYQPPEPLPEARSDTLVGTTSEESLAAEHTPKLELVEPCSTDTPRCSRGKQIIISLKKPFRRVSRGLRKWRKIDDG